MTEPRFFSVQRAFTAHLRDPDNAPVPPGLPSERVAVYSNAVIRNAEMFIGENFPRIREVLSESAWSAMVRDYLVRHASTTPLFVELPGEFLKYLDESRDDPQDPPYLYELAHFEFLETEVSADEVRIEEVGGVRDGDVMREVPVMNPTLRLVRYTYPVHHFDLSGEALEPPATPTFIAAYRDRDNRFGFIDLNAPSARAVELLLGDEPLTGQQVMRTIAAELNHPDENAVIAGGRDILERLAGRGAILGTLAD